MKARTMPSDKAMKLIRAWGYNGETELAALIDTALAEACEQAVRDQDGYNNTKPEAYMSARWVVGNILWLRNKVARCEISDRDCEVRAEVSVQKYGKQCADEAREQEREAARGLVEAASKIKHWHDCLPNDKNECEGIVVSAASVRELWAALATYNDNRKG